MDFLGQYLDKVQFKGNLTPDYETLENLQFLHLSTFPFENLNPLFGKEVSLDKDSLNQKFLAQNRGGYCFEQNLFFLNVLKSIGFNVRPLLGRVHSDKGISGRTHLLLLAEIDKKQYITDVGFGGLCIPKPIRIDSEIAQPTVFGDYKITKDKNLYHLKLKFDDEWRTLYSFDMIEPVWADFMVGN